MDEPTKQAVQRRRELWYVSSLTLGGCVVGYLVSGTTGLEIAGILGFLGSLASVAFSRFLIRRSRRRLGGHS